jgi:AcrR family transcriptional regulator
MGRAYTETEREELRIKIKEYGKKMFEKEGFKKFRIQNLTKEVGISLGGLYTFFENKEALYQEIINDEKNRIRLKISTWIENDNIAPKEYVISLANILYEKAKKNRLYESQQDGPYNLMSELVFDIGENNKKENVAFVQRLREIWEKQGNTLKISNEEILGILSILGAVSMKQNTMDTEVFEKLYRDIYMYLVKKIV